MSSRPDLAFAAEPDAMLARARMTFDIEAAAVLGLKAARGRELRRRRSKDPRGARPRGGHGHGQERPRRPQDRRHARLDRHAGDVRAPGRSQPRRPRHDQVGRPGAGHLQQRRGRGADRDPAGRQAPGRAADRDHRRADSTLARHADIVLDSGVEKEACPLNLAPTASTTAQMALGDALAVALLDARGFGTEDFARSHPGGALGPQAAHPRERRHALRRRRAARRARQPASANSCAR